VIENDGDIVRGLGFVTLYSAYLEEQIDNLLIQLSPIEEYKEDKQRWPISRKIKLAKKIVRKLDFEGRDDLIQNLTTCKELFEDRNELVHGRIYAHFDRPDTLKPGRPDSPEREVESEELYRLANEFDDLALVIYRPIVFKIPQAIQIYLSYKA
jgi:hypothetical protein